MQTKKVGRNPIAIGSFGAWILANLAINEWVYEDLSKRAHIHKNVICKHVRHVWKPSFQTVTAYCYAFGMRDDPQLIWRIVQKDWA